MLLIKHFNQIVLLIGVQLVRIGPISCYPALRDKNVMNRLTKTQTVAAVI